MTIDLDVVTKALEGVRQLDGVQLAELGGAVLGGTFALAGAIVGAVRVGCRVAKLGWRVASLCARGLAVAPVLAAGAMLPRPSQEAQAWIEAIEDPATTYSKAQGDTSKGVKSGDRFRNQRMLVEFPCDANQWKLGLWIVYPTSKGEDRQDCRPHLTARDLGRIERAAERRRAAILQDEARAQRELMVDHLRGKTL